jgi:hypothetical protein
MEKGSLRVAGCLRKVVLAALMMEVCWECKAALAAHLLDPLAEQVWSDSSL